MNILTLDVIKKGHDRESNTGLEGHSLSRYHYAIMAMIGFVSGSAC